MRRVLVVLVSVLTVLASLAGALATAGPSAAAATKPWDGLVLGDGFEYGLGDWSVTADSADQHWHRAGVGQHTGVFAARLIGPSSTADESLATPDLPIGSDAVLSFWHRYDFEFGDGQAYDGGVVEYSTDAGSTWHDVNDLVTMPYTGTVSDQTDNPLGGRPAFTGLQSDYSQVQVSLPQLAGTTARFRFRFGADAAASSNGWWIDDVAITDSASAAPVLPPAPGAVQAVSSGVATSITFTPAGGKPSRPVVAHVATCTAPRAPTVSAWTRQGEVELRGMRSGVSYACRVRAWTSAGLGAASAPVQVIGRPARQVSSTHRPLSARAAALAAAVRPGSTPQMDDELGVPTTLWARRPGPARPHADPVVAARAHLARLAPVYGLSRADLATVRLAGVQDLGHGAIVVQFSQVVDGVEVWGQRLVLVMRQDRRLVGATGYVLPATVADPRVLVSPRAATAAAYADLTGRSVDLRTASARGGYQRFVTPGLTAPARTRPVLYRRADGLVHGYYVELQSRAAGQPLTGGYVVSAVDGSVLSKTDLTAEDADPSTYRVLADPTSGIPWVGPQGDDVWPHPTGTPDGHQTSFVAANPVPGPVTGDPWMYVGGTESNGNNADAYTDITAPDGFTPGSADQRATTTSPGVFDHTYSYPLDPQADDEQAQAGVTQLFYDVNFLHDFFYGSGFDEAAGNAQDDNFHRGGVDGDPLLAEEQDSAPDLRNNANMTTPADGASPRMQMYVWDGVATAGLTLSPGGSVAVGTAAFGAQTFDKTASVVAASDSGGVSTTDGCEPLTTQVLGQVALVDRGACSFQVKAVNAQAAGAIGVIVANTVVGGPAIAMPCPSEGCGSLSIAAMSISKADGDALRTAVAGGTVSAHLQRSAPVTRDGALDTTVVAHEWGHYLSGRLVPSLSSQQAGAMGEGWSDFVALLLLVRPEDVAHLDGAFPVGGYAAAVTSSPDELYFGIRRVPYSTDFAKDALTFGDISDGQALPAVPTNDTGAPNSEVHAAGEVWASMLWESYAAMLADTTGDSPRLSFAEAQARMKDYLVASLKATPADPTFLEARDALLLVAEASDEADFQDLAAAFARRGAGGAAVGPDRGSGDLTGVVESYDPDFSSQVAIDASGGVVGSNGWYTTSPTLRVRTLGGAAGLRCVVDDPTHATYADLFDDPREPCDYTGPGAQLPTGVHTLYAAAQGVGGDQVGAATVNVDSDPPTTRLDALAPFFSGSSLSVPFGADDLGSGVATYTLEQRGATPKDTGLPDVWSPVVTTAKSKLVLGGLGPGGTWCLRIKATDVAGNVGQPSTVTCTSRFIDDAKAKRSAGWSTAADKAFEGGKAATARKKGASLTLGTVHAARVGLRASTCPGCGAVTVFVGAKRVGTLSLAGPARTATVLSLPLGTVLTGALKVVTTSAKPVTIDGLGASLAVSARGPRGPST